MRVVAAVIRDNGEFLVCRRGANKELAGKWEFPGGKVEVEESDQAALVREIHEELRVAIVVEDFIVASSMPRGLGTIEMFTYFARLESSRPLNSSDHDRLEWLKKEELYGLDWADLDIPVVHSIRNLS